MILIVQVISGTIWENLWVSIIDPLENLETAVGDGWRGSGREGREKYPLHDFWPILPWRLITGSLGQKQMVCSIYSMKDLFTRPTKDSDGTP